MILVPIIFILLGVLIKYGKMYSLIAGYNTMSKEEQEKYDIAGIATLFRNVMFVMAFLIAIAIAFSEMFDYEFLKIIAIAIVVPLGVIYLITKSNSGTYKQH